MRRESDFFDKKTDKFFQKCNFLPSLKPLLVEGRAARQQKGCDDMKRFKIFKTGLAAGTAALMALCLFAGCGASSGGSGDYAVSTTAVSSNSMAADAVMEEAGYAPETAALADTAGELDPEDFAQDRKIIYTADVDIETENYEDGVTTIRSLLDETGGYISSTSQSGSSTDGNRRANYTCRIPSGEYRSFLDGLSGAGNVYSVSEYTDDITMEYIDVEARLSSLESQRDRLQQLADEAEDIETLLSIETQLSNVQYQLESYTAQMRSYDNQVDYSTVNIYLREVRKVSEGTGFGTRIRAAFSGSWENFVSGVQGFVIAVIYALPMIVILAVIAVIVIPIVVRHNRRVRAHRSETLASGGQGWNHVQSAPEKKTEEKETPDQKE